MRVLLLGTLLCVGCSSSAKPTTAPARPTPPPTLTFAVLPAESDAFPLAARATTEQLQRSHLDNLPAPQLSKVSLEVVQLAIECVEPTPACYAAVGKELSANHLLFAQIAPGPKRKQVEIRVTWFDVDARQNKRSVIKLFASEAEASSSIGDVIAEVTKP